jgi:hypothetical protein
LEILAREILQLWQIWTSVSRIIFCVSVTTKEGLFIAKKGTQVLRKRRSIFHIYGRIRIVSRVKVV